MIENRVSDKTKKIAELNDKVRSTFNNGQILATKNFKALDDNTQSLAIEAIRKFTDFNESNDPHGEHDTAIVKVREIKKAFKFSFSYFEKENAINRSMPEIEQITKRVMTIDVAHYID